MPVYLIVIFEKSPQEFKVGIKDEFGNVNKQEAYIHHVKPESDTGIELNLLNNYCS